MRARRTVVTGCGLLLVPVVLAGCGGADEAASGSAGNPAVAACRDKWAALGKDIASEDSRTEPSALPDRWNSVSATVDYYRTSARKKDCGDNLDHQQKAIAALKKFSAALAPFDMESRLAAVKDDATAYAAGPWPAAPTPSASPSAKGKKKARKPQPLPRPPRPALVEAALRTLTTQAPIATREQDAGWEQAGVTEIGDEAAVAKAVKDLRFLSSESPAWRKCAASLALVAQALAAKSR